MPESLSPLEQAVRYRISMLLYSNTYPTAPYPKPDWYEWAGYSFDQTPPAWYQAPLTVSPPWYPIVNAEINPEVPTWNSFLVENNLTWAPPYPPAPPYIIPPPPVILTDYKTMYEELCCVGYNPDTAELEAIIRIKLQWGYGGNTCQPGTFESVGFWIQLTNQNCTDVPGTLVFVGEKNVRVYDIQRGNDCMVLHYAVKLPMPPTLVNRIYNSVECSDPIKTAKLHCVLGWNQVINENNYNGAGVFWGNTMTVPIQLHKSNKLGVWKTLPNNSEVQAIHAGLLKNGKVLYFASGNMMIFDPNKETVIPTTSPMLDSPRPTPTIQIPINAWNNIPNPAPDKPRDELVEQLSDYMVEFGTTDNNTLFSTVRYRFTKDLFCCGHTLLPDGNFLIAGGNEVYAKHGVHGDLQHFIGRKTLSYYDVDNGVWVEISPTLKYGRWYPTTIALGDGRIFISSGHPDDAEIHLLEDNTDPLYRDKNNTGKGFPNTQNSTAWVKTGDTIKRRHQNFDIEIYNPNTKSIEYIPNADVELAGGVIYPRLFLLPSGNIFNPHAVEEIPDYDIPYEDIDASQIPNIQESKYSSGRLIRVYRRVETNGIFIYDLSIHRWRRILDSNEQRWSHAPVMLPIKSSNNYQATIIQIDYPDSNGVSQSSMIIPEPNTGQCTGWQPLPQRKITHWRLDGMSLLLADGTTLFLGGYYSPFDTSWFNVNEDICKSIYNNLPNDPNNPTRKAVGIMNFVMDTEIFDPFVQPQNDPWSLGSPIKYPRGYHTTAILLPDGRVFLAGSERYGLVDVRTSNACPGREVAVYGRQSFSNDGRHQIEIYTPDYLLRGPRPAYIIAKSTFAYGEEFQLRLVHNSGVDWQYDSNDANCNVMLDRIMLIRCASNTHSFTIDQRCVILDVVKPSGPNSFTNGEDVFLQPKTRKVPASPMVTSAEKDSFSPDRAKQQITLKIPRDRDILPPGHYMLFVLSKAGVPSIGEIVCIA